MNFKRQYAKIIGTGSYIPDKVLTNEDLEKMVDTNDEWIVSRTGIRERRIADEGDATSDLASRAAINACNDAGIKPSDIDLIIVATVTPDMAFPSTACIVQKNIGASHAAAFDVEAACTGFIYGITIAAQFIETGFYKNVIVIGADILSRITDWKDRNTCVLFGDGAGAAVITASDEDGIISSYLASDGDGGEYVTCPAGGSRMPASHETIDNRLHYTHMSGNDVFRFAVKAMPEAISKALENCHMSADDIDLVFPHQANIRIIESASKKLNIPMEKIVLTIDKYGNTSSASIPVAIDEYSRSSRIKKGDRMALVGFGGGLTWGASIIKWLK